MGKAPARSYEWFRNARFGMFIHYGLYSITGRGECVMFYEKTPWKDYFPLARRFKPEKSAVHNWVKLAGESGMKYLCLTTKHFEGFCLWDTRTTRFNSVNSPARRDLVAEYVAACREADMGVGLYFSIPEVYTQAGIAGPQKNPSGWKRFIERTHGQLRELMTNYGRIDYLFYDGCPPPQTWGCAGINAEIRRLQPGILISSRCRLDEDVISAEGHTLGIDPGKLWETCMTTNDSWGYNFGDHSWKSARQIVQTLILCVHNGGNFLLNVGPMGNGCIPPPAVKALQEVGRWIEKNGAAIFNTEPHPFGYADQRFSMGRGNTVYMALGDMHYHGPKTVLWGIGNRIKAIRLLATGRPIAFRQKQDLVYLTGLPQSTPDPIMPVIVMDLDGKPQGVRRYRYSK